MSSGIITAMGDELDLVRLAIYDVLRDRIVLVRDIERLTMQLWISPTVQLALGEKRRPGESLEDWDRRDRLFEECARVLRRVMEFD